MAELGALSLRIQEQGGERVLQKLRDIDSAARLTGTSADQAAAALNSLGIAAKVVDGNISVAEKEVERATSIVRQLGSDAKVTAGEVDKLGAKMAKLTAPKPFLGPGLPSTTTDSASRASAAAASRMAADAEQAISRRIQLLAQGARLEATRADAVRRLIGIEAGLTAALTKGNLTQEERIRLNVLLARTQNAVASGTENVAAAQAAKAAADQQAIDAAEREAYAMDRQRTAADKMSPKIRSGASALAALSIAAATGGGSLVGMATQAGLVGSVMAAEFAPAKWAGYAAGIGAVVIGLTALIGVMAKLREERAKASPLALQQIADIRQVDLAEQAYTERRLERERLQAEIAKRGPLIPLGRGGGQAAARTAQLKDELKKAETLEAEALKKFQEVRNQSIKEGAATATDAMVAAAEATKAVRLSVLAKEQAEVEAAFQKGTASLKEQYDGRRKVIIEGAEAERKALEARRAALLKVLPGEDPRGAAVAGRRVEAGQVSAEIKALANQTAAQLTALDQQRANEEKALAAKVLAYEAQSEAVRDTAFQKRRAQIQIEAEERRKAVFQATGDEVAAAAARDELIGQRTTELLLQKAQSDLARLQLSLDTQRQAIQNDLAAGRLSELEASQRIADVERSAVPEMERLVELALQFATALGEAGAIAGLEELRAKLQGLGVDLLDPILVAKKQVQGQLDSLGTELGSVFADAIAAAAGGESGKKAILRGLGGIFSEMGRALIAYGVAMLKLLPALTNPFTSGPAAIAAGALLVALGATLGAAAGGRGSGGASAGGSTAPTPISISRLVVDPNAGVRQRIASTGMQSAAAPGGPTPVIEVIGISTPRGQALIGTASARYQDRGG